LVKSTNIIVIILFVCLKLLYFNVLALQC